MVSYVIDKVGMVELVSAKFLIGIIFNMLVGRWGIIYWIIVLGYWGEDKCDLVEDNDDKIGHIEALIDAFCVLIPKLCTRERIWHAGEKED